MEKIKDPENSIIFISDYNSFDRIDFEKVCLLNTIQLKETYKRNKFNIDYTFSQLEKIYNVHCTDFIANDIKKNMQTLLDYNGDSNPFYIPNLDITVILTDYEYRGSFITAVTGFHFGEEYDSNFNFSPIAILE